MKTNSTARPRPRRVGDQAQSVTNTPNYLNKKQGIFNAQSPQAPPLQRQQPQQQQPPQAPPLQRLQPPQQQYQQQQQQYQPQQYQQQQQQQYQQHNNL